MLYYSRNQPPEFGGISPLDVILFEEITKVIQSIPNELSPKLSCHGIAQFIQEKWGLKRFDGYFICRGWEHSWNLYKHGRLILDAYPIGGERPILVNIGSPRIRLRPWREAYKTHKLNLRERELPTPREQARLIRKALKF